MPNPFKRSGSAFHQPADWVAPDAGLIGKLAQARSGGELGNIAFIGDIGQGKTAATSYYAKDAAKKGLVFQYSLQTFLPEEAFDLLYGPIYNDLIERLGESAADAALKKTGLNGRTKEPNLRRDQITRLIEAMALASYEAGRPVHIVVDECQVPAEAFEHQSDVRKITEWFESLKSIAEAFRAGKGHVVVAITPSPWEMAPQKVRDRFAQITATTPDASEIQSFVKAGLTRATDGPKRAANDLGAVILKTYEEKVSITVRSLHERLHPAWERARGEKAEELNASHIVS